MDLVVVASSRYGPVAGLPAPAPTPNTPFTVYRLFKFLRKNLLRARWYKIIAALCSTLGVTLATPLIVMASTLAKNAYVFGALKSWLADGCLY